MSHPEGGAGEVLDDHRLAELDRRLSALEARHMELVQEVATHSAVCVTQQKMMLNTMASIEALFSKLDDRIEKMATKIDERIDNLAGSTSKRLDGWLTAIAGAALLSTGSLVLLIMTRGLK